MNPLEQPLADVRPGSLYWTKCREHCKLTCSDYPSACNAVDAYMSRIKLFKMKTGQLKDDHPCLMTQQLRINGQYQEKLAVQWFESIPNDNVKFFRPGFWIDREDPRLGGSPDGLLSVYGEDYVVEIKNPSEMIEAPKDVKWRHVIQLMGLMHASGVRLGVLCYYSSMFVAPNLFMVIFSDHLWNFIYKKLETFLRCLEKNEPPHSPCDKTFREWDITEFVFRMPVEELCFFQNKITD